MLVGCESTVSSSVVSYNPPTSSSTVIQVFGTSDAVYPNTAQVVGNIAIGDSGFSLNCGYQVVLGKAREEARAIGADAIKLTSISPPDSRSTCYRLTATALKFPNYSSNANISLDTKYTEKSLREEWNLTGADEIEGIYEYFTLRTYNNEPAQAQRYRLAVKKIDSDNYNVIYLDGFISPDPRLNWRAGELKAKFERTAAQGLFAVREWYMADKSVTKSMYLSFENGIMTQYISDPPTQAEIDFLKLFPTSGSLPSEPEAQLYSSGTGFSVHPNGLIVTNHHVIGESKEIFVKGINGDFNISYHASVILSDQKNDIALLKVDDEKFTPTNNPPYSFSHNLAKVGESVFALGYPLRASMGDEIKLTNGIISSSSGYQGDATSYQVSVPVQPGNSGGPLVDSQGNIVGIINARHTGAANASYAIKISYMFNLLDSAGETLIPTPASSLDGLSLSEQVQAIKDYVYIIEAQN
jgi:S1-C subfamily serine protease